ncbi:uncharacterized protein [Nicotiana tomentosiformis]|uniref:uncharacterized protein n=1 Tax=Nicotiana tomentosiformis TaxID=4098 RepID=UPI00388CD479
MQARKNKYQRDNRGNIVDNKQGNEADKGKGKAKVEEVATKNKFNALEVEEVHQPTLQMTEGKGEDHNNGKKKEHGEKQAKKGQEKEKEVNTQQEHKRVKKEAVEKFLKMISSVPSDQRTDKRANKKSTIDWVHRRFGTSNEELKQLNVTIKQSCHEIPSQTFKDSGQIEDLDEVNSTKVLWSDAVEVKDDQLGTTKTTEDKVKKDSKPSSLGDRLATPGLNPGSPGVRLATPGLKPGSPGIRLAMPDLKPGSPDVRLATPGLKPGSPSVRLATPGLKPGSPDEAATVNPNLSATGEILSM